MRKQFYISSPSKSRNYPPDYDFWKAFNSLLFVKDLEISLDKLLHEISDNAFEPINKILNCLRCIVFDENDYTISRIGNNAFSEIPNLSVLSFSNIWIFNISAKAFDFKKNSRQPLNINFYNCLMTESNLEEGIFSDAKQRLILDFCKN